MAQECIVLCGGPYYWAYMQLCM